MTPEQKVVLDEAVAKTDELVKLLRDSLPLRATGGGHVHNELLTLNTKLKKLAGDVTVA